MHQGHETTIKAPVFRHRKESNLPKKQKWAISKLQGNKLLFSGIAVPKNVPAIMLASWKNMRWQNTISNHVKPH